MDTLYEDDALGEPDAAGPSPLAAIHAALGARQVEQAISLAEAALQAGGRDPLLFNLVAHRRQVEGRYGEAMGLLQAALALAPQDAFLRCALAGCLSQQGRDAEALALYDAVLATTPRHAQAHCGRGLALDALEQAEPARAAYQRAVELAEDYPDALGALAAHALRRGESDQAQAYARRALTADPDEPAAILALATLESKRGEASAAADRLQRRLARPGLSALHQGALGALYADALDRLDRPEAAMEAHVRANAATWAVHAPLLAAAGVETGINLCRRLRARFEQADPADWTAAPGAQSAGPGAPAGHVFLIGFVRSGTTLLEQVLASHPRVSALEEMPLLRALAKPWFDDDAGLDRLAALDEGQAEALRADYWRRVRSHGIEPAGRVFVDKNPLDGLWLPLVAKLFPDARILIARRDPRDVVVSSFRHRFKVNVLTCAFTDLQRTADYYAAVMALTQTYLARLPLHVHVHRHEDLVAHFDGEVRAICDFVGLEWTEALRDFAATARRRDIRTPSADQVRQGLSREGLGRWRRYEAAMQPILPVLQPWVEAFGYA